ncbi:MAG: hypothetical protein IH876_16480 [Gemmatimonadetes bacterium]|nr:hypothetical protein [Gemmatimonadota bacterium]
MANSKDGENNRTAHVRTRTDGPTKEGEENFTDAQRAFLECYREMGVIRRACKVAKVGRSSHYEWMEDNPAYRAAFEAAKEDAADTLEAEVFRRAVTGVEKPVGWYKGVAGGKVREYSDLLLMFRLKALRPEKYRERVDVRGVLAHLDVSLLPDELVARLAAGENPISVLAPVLQAAEVPALPPSEESEGA